MEEKERLERENEELQGCNTQIDVTTSLSVRPGMYLGATTRSGRSQELDCSLPFGQIYKLLTVFSTAKWLISANTIVCRTLYIRIRLLMHKYSNMSPHALTKIKIPPILSTLLACCLLFHDGLPPRLLKRGLFSA